MYISVFSYMCIARSRTSCISSVICPSSCVPAPASSNSVCMSMSTSDFSAEEELYKTQWYARASSRRRAKSSDAHAPPRQREQHRAALVELCRPDLCQLELSTRFVVIFLVAWGGLKNRLFYSTLRAGPVSPPVQSVLQGCWSWSAIMVARR